MSVTPKGLRGQPASNTQVELYRLLHRADRPMTMAELTGPLGMPAVYKTAGAFREYRERFADVPAADRPVPIRNFEKWTQQEMDAVWVWWITGEVELGRIKNRILVTAEDGSSPVGKRGPKVYAANRGNPPVVRVQVPTSVLTHWTPAVDEVNARHNAGVLFLRQVDALLAKPRLASDVRQALILAAEAIRVTRVAE